MYSLGRREKYFALNTLTAVPILLIGKCVLIDMKNETSVAGRITNADGYMNITLEEVVFIDQKNIQHALEDFMIPARNIRQINIPDNIDISKKLNMFISKQTERKRSKKEPMNMKQLRAMRRHKETLKTINPTDSNEMKEKTTL